MQRHQSSTPGAAAFVAKLEGRDHVEPFQQGVYGSPQGACPLAVDDADLQDAFISAFFKVVRDQVLDIRRAEGVEVQGAVNGYLDRINFVHVHQGA